MRRTGSVAPRVVPLSSSEGVPPAPPDATARHRLPRFAGRHPRILLLADTTGRRPTPRRRPTPGASAQAELLAEYGEQDPQPARGGQPAGHDRERKGEVGRDLVADARSLGAATLEIPPRVMGAPEDVHRMQAPWRDRRHRARGTRPAIRPHPASAART